jgi:hypothetical protein
VPLEVPLKCRLWGESLERRLLDEIVAFLEDETGEHHLVPATSLNYDLELHGDDAERVMVHFKQRFEIDMSNFDFGQYFLPETHGFVSPFVLFVTFVQQVILGIRKVLIDVRTGEPLIPLRVADLYHGATNRNWTSNE